MDGPMRAYDDDPRPAASVSRRRAMWLSTAVVLYAAGIGRAVAAPMRATLDAGLRAMRSLALSLRAGELTPPQWQDEMARLVATLPVDEAIEAIELDALLATLDRLPADRPHVQGITSPLAQALQQALREAGMRLKLFALGPGRAIVPHGHHDMVSMHWVLRGALHGRHFDRLALDRTHVVMRPTLDAVLRAGAASSISDDRDNIHWFVAVDGPAYALDVIVSHLHPEGPHGRFYVDPRAAIHVGDDRLRAPRLSPADARRRYGRA